MNDNSRFEAIVDQINKACDSMPVECAFVVLLAPHSDVTCSGCRMLIVSNVSPEIVRAVVQVALGQLSEERGTETLQ